MATKVMKTKAKIPQVVGTKPSIKNAQLLVSTGIPSLDNVIGGGLPVGSLFIVEEDAYGTYAKYVLKYFMAESVVTTNALLVASQDIKPSQLIQEIPAVITDTVPHDTEEPIDEKMKIAWRYQNMKIVDSFSASGQDFGHYYDLTKTMDKDVIENADITQWHEGNNRWGCKIFENIAYVDLLKTIQETLKKGEYFISDSPEKRNILRVAIHSLGSRLWLCDNEESAHEDLLKFLYCLRGLLRNSYAVGTITVPTDNFNNSNAIVERLEHLSDVSIKLESFAGSPKATNPLFKDYHGLLHIKKLSALNTLAPHCPESRDLAFVLRRKKFLISVLHLPPELSDTAQREQDELPLNSGCGGGAKKNLLDF